MAWHAKSTGSYSRTSTEGLENARGIADILAADGWVISAIAALLGNGAGESGLNPWRWEGDNIPTVAQFSEWATSNKHGYGIPGFTPPNTYINSTNSTKYAADGYKPNFADRPGAPEDGAAQTAYMRDTVPLNWSSGNFDYYNDDFTAIGVDIRNFYYITFDQFKAGKIAGADIQLDYMTGAFELKYEKPRDDLAAQSYRIRCDNAAYWYEYFTGHPPTPTPSNRKLKIWMSMNAWT